MKRIEQVKRNIARPLAEFWRIGMLRKNRATSWTPTMVCRYLVVCVIAMFATIASYASSSVPPVVLSSNSTVPSTGLASNPNGIALDACGNLYTVHGYGEMSGKPRQAAERRRRYMRAQAPTGQGTSTSSSTLPRPIFTLRKDTAAMEASFIRFP